MSGDVRSESRLIRPERASGSSRVELLDGVVRLTVASLVQVQLLVRPDLIEEAPGVRGCAVDVIRRVDEAQLDVIDDGVVGAVVDVQDDSVAVVGQGGAST